MIPQKASVLYRYAITFLELVTRTERSKSQVHRVSPVCVDKPPLDIQPAVKTAMDALAHGRGTAQPDLACAACIFLVAAGDAPPQLPATLIGY